MPAMQKLTFNHTSRWDFESEATDHRFVLRVLPHDDPGQRVSGLEVSVEPADETLRQADGFGNVLLVGSCLGPHASFSCSVSGTAEVDASRGHGGEPGEGFLYPSALTQPGPQLLALHARAGRRAGAELLAAESLAPASPGAQVGAAGFAGPRAPASPCAQASPADPVGPSAQVGPASPVGPGTQADPASPVGPGAQADPADLRERARDLCALVHGAMEYASGSTDVSTSAEEALRQGRGVCQDYAHILEAVLRLDGIPARYVSGLMIGEGATHAWAEFFDGRAWRGLDPTNDCEAGDLYIAVARGRDFADCPMEQGVLKGGGSQRLTTSVSVAAAPAG